MIATANGSDRNDSQFDDASDTARFERFTYRRGGDFPARSQAARTRAKMRDRATPASRTKSRSFNGSNRRGRGKQWATLS